MIKAPRSQRKSHSQEWLFCLLFLFPLFALNGCQREPAVVQLAGDTMGTTWHVTYVGAPSLLSADVVQRGIEVQLDTVDQSMSTYRADSEISLVNATEPGTPVTISADFAHVLEAALEVGSKSGGAYDVTVAPLVDLWGFGPPGAVIKPPERERVLELLRLVGQDKLNVDPAARRLQKVAPVSLDFSSLAKGYAVDRVAGWLQGQGIMRFMVEVGGEIRLAGASARGDNWRIAIEEPASDDRAPATALSLSDTALATSGDYRNYFEVEGRRYSHSIDPRTGYPVAHELVSVTVAHASALYADAWATALLVLGPEQAMAVAQAQSLAVYFIRGEEGLLQHNYTAQFEPYLVADQAGTGGAHP